VSIVAALVLGASAASPLSVYSYAGVTSRSSVGGILATITLERPMQVRDGHVGAWVGVGGPGEGADGTDAWIQVGFAAFAGGSSGEVYYEIRRGVFYAYTTLASNVRVGDRHRFAVLEDRSRRGWWRGWVDGLPAGPAVFMPESHAAWAGQFVAENWAAPDACNAFAFRVANVSLRGVGTTSPVTSPALESFAEHGMRILGSGRAFSVRRGCP
jgi:hypothetical protein